MPVEEGRRAAPRRAPTDTLAVLLGLEYGPLSLPLRPYQLHSLVDEMGLGKTAQALAHIWVEKQAARPDRPALVIVPTSLRFN